MAWDRDMSPAVTKPTSMTVVTDEDWMMAVTKAPVISPMMRLLVSLARICFMLSPATFLSASAICSMPYRNTARPPTRVMPITHQSITCSPPPEAAARTGMAVIPEIAPRIRTRAIWGLPSAANNFRKRFIAYLLPGWGLTLLLNLGSRVPPLFSSADALRCLHTLFAIWYSTGRKTETRNMTLTNTAPTVPIIM